MCAVAVAVILEFEQIVLEISGRPEQLSVQIFTANGPDEPFQERVKEM